MTRSRLLLLIGVIAALAIALFLWLRDRGEAPGATGGEAARPQETGGVGSTSNDRVAGRGPRRGAPTPGAPDVGAQDGMREYRTDHGARVRDHAPNPDVEPAIYPGPLPPEQRTMNPQLTSALVRELRPIVNRCGKDIPVEDRGAKPTVMVTLTVDIAGGSLRATDASVAPLDIAEGRRDALVTCVREAAAAVTIPSGNEPDRTDYVTHFPITLR